MLRLQRADAAFAAVAPPRVWKNDGNIEHINGLPGKERTLCCDGLGLVVMLDVTVQDILFPESDLRTFRWGSVQGHRHNTNTFHPS